MEKDENTVSKFVFSKAITDLDLLKCDSVKELLNYINNKDVELNKVKILMRKANRELKISSRQLFIRKEEAENRICITKR